MDKNKLKVLKQISYTIPKHCGICVHSDIAPGRNFGDCMLHRYTHEKHTSTGKNLSVHRIGCCQTNDFELDQQKLSSLSGHAQFVDRRVFTRSNRHKQRTST